MEDRIKRLYEKQKYGRVKAMGYELAGVAFMAAIVSVVEGNPFTHKETVLFFEVNQPGWITTSPYLFWFCAAVGIVAGIAGFSLVILREFSKFDRVLLQECDSVKYLEMMAYLVTYGKSVERKGFQKSILLIGEQRYVAALIANDELEQAEAYVMHEWEGKRTKRLYRQALTNIELEKKYKAKDAEGYVHTLENAEKVFQTNKLFIAKKLILKNDYRQALDVLEKRKEKVLYYEVARQFLMGVCYYQTGEAERGKACMEYVMIHGNTLHCKQEAEEYLEMSK